MKKDRVATFLWGFAFSFFLSCSAVMWMVSAFTFGVETDVLIVFCLIAALVCSICYTLPLSAVPLGLGALCLGFLWRDGALEMGVEALLNRLTRQYNKAYHWPIIRWGVRTADEMEPTIITALCILAAITALVTAWTVCRKKSAVCPLLSIVYVSTCFVVNDTVPSAGWIFLLLMTVLALMMTCSVRSQDEAEGNRLCLILTPLIALGLLTVFLTNPKSTYDRQNAAKEMMDKVLGADHIQYLMGGLSENNTVISNQKVDLTVVGYRTSPEGRVMEVTAPFTGVLYLRSRAMDSYDGKSWSHSGGPDIPWPETFLENVGEVKISTRFAHQTLYMPYYSQFGGFTDIGPGALNEKNLKEYSFACQQLPANMTPATAAMLSSVYWPIQLDKYLYITPEVKQWAEPYALEITKGAGSFSEKAERIASFVRNSAQYDLETPRMPQRSADFARWFLEDSDTGYCVHFATATAVLLQALGIPARYVTGYMTVVKAGEVTQVKSKESHAWVEYWLPNFGWTVLEATPPAALPEAPQPTETQTTPGTDPQAPTSPTTTEDTLQTQQTGTTNPQNPADPMSPEQERSVLTGAIVWTGITVLALTAIAAQRSIRIRLRRKRQAEASANDKALLYWQELVGLAKLMKIRLPGRLRMLAEKAKFSQYTLTPEELQAFEDFRESAVSTLKKHNLFLQIYYCLILAKY